MRPSALIGVVVGVALRAATVCAAAPQGTVERTLKVDGLARTYYLFVPDEKAGALPVVIVLHGGGGTPRQMARYTRFSELAAKEKFAVLYPAAVDGNWNDGRGVPLVRAQRDNIDDVKFLRQMLDDAAGQASLDRTRVFVTGMSNGGFMANRLAAEAADIIAAVAPVCGGMAPSIAERFQPQFPISALIVQGDADPLVPVDGGDVVVAMGRSRGETIPTTEVVARYVARNGNPGQPTETLRDVDPDDGIAVEMLRYADGPGGVKTWLYLVEGGGHTWPGRPGYLPEAVIGKASQDFSATDEIWAFFKSCPPRALPAK